MEVDLETKNARDICEMSVMVGAHLHIVRYNCAMSNAAMMIMMMMFVYPTQCGIASNCDSTRAINKFPPSICRITRWLHIHQSL